MLFLLRLAETGREAQPKRNKVRKDVVAAIERALPGARLRTEVGRIWVDVGGDPGAARAALAAIHGVASFSPVTRCSLAELERAVADVAAPRLAAGRTFRVSVKRVGDHPFTSQQLAARLGAAIVDRIRDVRVDLASPDIDIGVEVRAGDCFVFDDVIPGMDRRETAAPGSGDRPRFLVDHMLGKLKVALRLLGFDTIYVRHEPDTEVIRTARAEGRVVVTRDRELSEMPTIRAVYVTAEELEDQLAEVLRALALSPDAGEMFSRCSLCNGLVDPVDKESIRDRLPGDVYAQYDEFTRCAACDKIYWKGGQYDRLIDKLRPE